LQAVLRQRAAHAPQKNTGVGEKAGDDAQAFEFLVRKACQRSSQRIGNYRNPGKNQDGVPAMPPSSIGGDRMCRHFAQRRRGQIPANRKVSGTLSQQLFRRIHLISLKIFNKFLGNQMTALARTMPSVASALAFVPNGRFYRGFFVEDGKD
jgi:hypothetical protein